MKKYNEDLITSYLKHLKQTSDNYKIPKNVANSKDSKGVLVLIHDDPDNRDFFMDIKYKPFGGHMSRLGHYYRHLFQTVKYVIDQKDDIIPDKYKYLKTLRAQLSNHEQLLLFYNAQSTFGTAWISNKYFTEYLMIKNLPLPLANFGIPPIELLGKLNSRGERIFEWDEVDQLHLEF